MKVRIMAKTEGEMMEGREASPESALLDRRGAFLGFLTKRLGNRTDAEDVLQEFSIRVLARRHQLREAERLDAWMYAILHSTLNDHFRKLARRNRLLAAVTCEPEPLVAEYPEDESRLCNCAGRLITDLRSADAELIRRIDFGEDDRGNVAADLGLSRNALGVRLHRARAALRNALIAHCGTCCETGRDDCFCPPEGCENDGHSSHCGPGDHPA
jgi:RNA polymerase sigma factor (sigma-70 family)